MGNDQTAFILLNETVPTSPRHMVYKISMVISMLNDLLPIPKIMFLNASTLYVAGSIAVKTESQVGSLSSGNSAPLRKKSGNATKLTII